MPELPEVETIVRGLQKKVLGRTFFDVWTDVPKIIKRPKNFKQFKKIIIGKKIRQIRRRGKNIIFSLSGGFSLLIHQKLTGHLLLSQWSFKRGRWLASKKPLSEKVNSYIHLLFTFDNGLMLALSDLRKFAKVELWNTEELNAAPEINELGPEPFDKALTFRRFCGIISYELPHPWRGGVSPSGQVLSAAFIPSAGAVGRSRRRKKRGKIKQILMDQKIVAGIGNIYSDEILFEAKIHPFREASQLSQGDIKRIYTAMKKILEKAIRLRGESISGFRDTAGEKGYFDKARKVYRRTGEKCRVCGTVIQRVKIGGRSAHFCPQCQKP